MEITGLCNICGKPGIMHNCMLCGKFVCNNCYNAKHNICIRCNI
jgi:hypothetical protein